MSSDLNDPIEVLNLSRRSYNYLHKAGYRTVRQVAELGEVRLRNIRRLGQPFATEVQKRLDAYFAERPSLKRPTPIEALGFSHYIYWMLVRHQVRTVEQLTELSDKEISHACGIDEDSLNQIKGRLNAYLAAHPLPTEAVTPEDRTESPPSDKPTPAMEESQLRLRPPEQSKTITIRASSPLLSQTPLKALGLSAHPYKTLTRDGITTVELLAAKPFWEVWDVSRIGYDSLVEIKGKLRTHLAEHPLLTKLAPDEKETQLPPYPSTSHKTGSTRVSSTSLRPIPLEELHLSARALNALVQDGITTVEQLAAISFRKIWDVPNIGYRSLTEITVKLKAYLVAHPLPTEPLLEEIPDLPARLSVQSETALPSASLPSSSSTSLEVLDLSIRPYNALVRSGITTVE